MADFVWASPSASAMSIRAGAPRHSRMVRATHWLTVIAFLALLVTGVEILISHPRFYWGETGNVNVQPLFRIPIPSSRSTVPTGYGYVLPDQNGWSRYLHFEAAWLLVLTGLLYFVHGVVSGHFRRNLFPARHDLTWQGISVVIAGHLRRSADESSYNVLQRLTYVAVIFVFVPLVIWTGLAMSPGVAAGFPSLVMILGGQQSARTIHFFVSIFLTVFLVVHVTMVILSGFGSRMRAMITGRMPVNKERL
jgi:thiosulfate reductase cytochrome b subunit